MGITSNTGPYVAASGNPLGSAGTLSANQNPDAGPSLYMYGYGMLDPRYPFTYGGVLGEQKCYGFANGGSGFQLINAVPSTISATNIAASQSPGAAALTLVSSSGAGITVGTSITRADTGATVTGLLAIDSAMAGVSFGQSTNINIWDPTKAISRNVRITSGGNDSGITFAVVGYDVYGYPMSEAITGANAGVASGAKAFKYITSITPSGAAASTVTAGTGDVIGIPMRADSFGTVTVFYNTAWITANTGFVAAVTTSPATTTTGDVRGTYALQSASDNSKRLVIYATPSVAQLSNATNLPTGLFGVAQNLASNNGA